MLPSRLFRNTGLSPALRSLVTPSASLPSTVAVQIRFRLGVLPGSLANAYSTSPAQSPSTTTTTTGTATNSEQSSSQNIESVQTDFTTNHKSGAPATTTSSQPLPEKLEPRLSITFTCTAPGCSERSTHQFTKRAYEKGIVLVQCPGCKNRHLIADNLGWFKDSTKEGKLRNIEDILREKGETVRRGRLDAGGVVEYAD